MKTPSAKFEADKRKWILVNAEDQVLGRLASQVAVRLRGKHLPTFTPHVDTGEFVVVVNAEKVRLTGNKLNQKLYYRYSGYMGGLKSTSARRLIQDHPDRMIRWVVGVCPRIAGPQAHKGQDLGRRASLPRRSSPHPSSSSRDKPRGKVSRWRNTAFMPERKTSIAGSRLPARTHGRVNSRPSTTIWPANPKMVIAQPMVLTGTGSARRAGHRAWRRFVWLARHGISGLLS
jgi:large subunit ribosomal protein L13